LPNSFIDGDWIELPHITDDGVRLIQTGNIGVGAYKEKGYRYISEESFNTLRCTEVAPQDILICRLADPVGRACLAPNMASKMITSVDVCILKPSKDYDARFIVYQLSTHEYLNFLDAISRGGTRDRISRTMLGAIDFMSPPLAEQRAIATHLDDKIRKIDALVEKKQRLIDLLKEQRTTIINQLVTTGINPSVRMKDSGIEGIGRIPEHWEVKKVKNEFAFLDHKRVPLSSEERGAMAEKVYDYYGASGVIDKVENYLFNETLILVGEDGANLYSRSTPLAFLATGKYWVNNHAHILRPTRGNINYLVHMLESLDYTPYVSGSAQPKLTIDNLANIKIPVPPVEEQRLILEHLNIEMNRIDAIGSLAQKHTDLLQEIRTALISEVVTGKIDVREHASGKND
jgi:type I restriction enzyme S subunit